MDGLYFRVSSERQTTENPFEDLLQAANGSVRRWNHIRESLSRCVIEEQRPAINGMAMTGYRLNGPLAARFRQLKSRFIGIGSGSSWRGLGFVRAVFASAMPVSARWRFQWFRGAKASAIVIASCYILAILLPHRGAVMALQLETAKISPDLTVVRVSGHMTFEGTDAVPSLIVTLLDRGVRKLILDLDGV